ncbi:PDZ domain-containing protein [Shewanella schlegeliana]|uniref:M61 family metallopeptidase n=1 Tax=Shewanella schlegeliana TaxID=190308 RepID=A0ABS1T111_9GAMM|nr:PDZ domain-containing protein [Shewanella schlegeliana]MBL4913517.1 M61 family metallopeptidase [Shewanella schlegeliana]MCL1108407.1 PDZ domain-containing protein [Shewanella schlegeliana]GIU28811.1 peptidase M61 [Shewanella schlegeliana]
MKPVVPLILTFSSLACANAVADVDYKIDLTSPEHHLAKVEVNFPVTESDSLVVNLPVWRTGKYQVLPLADAVRKFTATDDSGSLLPWTRTASGEWTVALSEPTSVTVNYQLYANKLGQRVNHIDASHAFLDASGTFVYSPEFRDEPIRVSLKVPNNWNSYSGMDRGAKEHSFAADNYDILVDSPIETGISEHREFSADGRQYELVVWGEGNYDIDKMVTDLTKLSGQADVIWDDYPFERYVYMVHATSGASGATEHLNSTIIQRPRFSYRERKDYLGFIKTASHEFIHTWNVKAYRPDGLVPYNYQDEEITELLWIAEGSTSYFQSQLLLRAGVMTAKEFFEDLARRVAQSEKTPGREIQSIASASANQWASSGGDYAVNHSTNIYSEGYLTSLALDFSLLEETKLKRSYRDVHRKLYNDYRIPAGYTIADVKGILDEVSGTSYEAWWQQYINSPVSLNFNALLAQAGLKTTYGKDAKIEPFTGVTLKSGSLVLSQVLRNGPAWNAGIVLGDEIVAINGLKVTASGFESRIKDFKAGDTIKVTLFSNDRLKELSLELGEQQSGKLSITSVDKPSRAQKAFFKAWLGVDWPFDKQGQFKSVQ